MSNTFRQIFRLTTLVAVSFFLLMIPAARSDEAKTIHVLFIGNSLTTANNLPQLIADLAKSRNHIMEYDVYAPGGKSLSDHASDSVTLSKVKEKAWDFVVLQEQGQAPAFADWEVQEEVYPFARQLIEAVRLANPQARVVFYMTMARREGDPHNAMKISLPELETYEGMQNRINQSYLTMATENNALIAPVGLVWKKVRQQYPSIDLYADEIHPNLTGTYLAACVFYTVFFKDISAGLAHPSVIDGQTVFAIQSIADEISQLPDLSGEITLASSFNVSAENKQRTDTIEKFIGTWMRDGRVMLIVKAQGDFLALESPIPGKSEIQFDNVQVKDGRLTFEEVFTKNDGTTKRYYFEMREDSDGIMRDRLSSTPSFEKASDQVLIKLENYPELTASPAGSVSNNVGNSQVQKSITNQKSGINIMEVVLFLNANQRNNGYASFKADNDKKTLQYFDSEGRLFEESYIDQNNDIVTKKYDQNGQVVSESKLTQSFIEETINKESDYDKETKRVAKNALIKLSAAAEDYKAAHGVYPTNINELREKTPALGKDYCQGGMSFYIIQCEFRAVGYTLTARPRYFDMNPGNFTYRITTGKILEEIDPGKR